MVCGPHNRARNHTADHPQWRRRFLEESDATDESEVDECSGLDPPGAD